MKKVLYYLLPLTLSTNVFAGSTYGKDCQTGALQGKNTTCIVVTYQQANNSNPASVSIRAELNGSEGPRGCNVPFKNPGTIAYWAPDGDKCGNLSSDKVTGMMLTYNGNTKTVPGKTSFPGGTMTDLEFYINQAQNTVCYSWGPTTPPAMKLGMTLDTAPCADGWTALKF